MGIARLHRHVPHPAAIGQLALEPVAVRRRRRRRARVRIEQRQHVPGIGDVAELQAQLLARLVRQGIADQVAHPERHRDRAAHALPPLLDRPRRAARTEYRQPQRDAVSGPGSGRLLHRPERGRQGRPVAVARSQQPGEIVRLRVHVEPDHRLVPRDRFDPARHVPHAIGARFALRIGQRKQAGKLLAGMHVGIEAVELGRGHFIRSEEQGLHRAQQRFRRMQLALQRRIGLVGQFIANEGLLHLLPLFLLMVHRQRQCQSCEQGEQAPQPGRQPPRRRHRDRAIGLAATVRRPHRIKFVEILVSWQGVHHAIP